MAKKNFYAVVKGRKTGIFTSWFGTDGAWQQVDGYPGAVYKGFPTRAEAKQWLQAQSKLLTAAHADPPPKKPLSTQKAAPPPASPTPGGDEVIIYTDGACLGNPGRGGYAAIILDKGQQQELCGGFIHTTNNRMELTACIAALEQLPAPRRVVLYSDSRYVVNGIKLGWAKRWRSRGWLKADKTPAENPDLWEKLLNLCETHQVEMVWLRGHAGHPLNERCDALALQTAQRRGLPPDQGYIQNKVG
ncbi:MAG: ribonuclease HI [Chloroflexota bacterium]